MAGSTKSKETGKVCNRYRVREDMVGLTTAEKKQIWNREAWLRRKQGVSVLDDPARAESSRVLAEAAAYRASICPSPTIFGEYGSREWCDRNEAFAATEARRILKGN